MNGALAAGAVLLAFAAAWELVGSDGGSLAGRVGSVLAGLGGDRRGSVEHAALRLGLPHRIARAGLAHRLDPAPVVAAKLAGAGLGIAVALVAAPALPPRLGLGASVLIAAAGFLTPDALLERTARRRRERLVAALPDAFDMLAVGAASGRGATVLIDDVAASTEGALAVELASTVAEIECGMPVGTAVERLRERVPGAEIGTLAAALDRSRRYGSPLAEQLHEQAIGLRRDARRRTAERAARAAPKIQLVVALILVPSVLLIIFAALVAHSEALFRGFG